MRNFKDIILEKLKLLRITVSSLGMNSLML